MKTNFKIVLDSNNTDSWTGILHNATYSINLRNILPDPKDYEKKYYMTVRYEMTSGLFATSTLSPDYSYYLNVDMGQPFNVLFNNSESIPVNPRNNIALLKYETDLYDWTGTSAPTYGYLTAVPSDNLGVVINNIKNLNYIKIATYDGTNKVIFNSVNTTAINNITKYIITLNFEEL